MARLAWRPFIFDAVTTTATVAVDHRQNAIRIQTRAQNDNSFELLNYILQ